MKRADVTVPKTSGRPKSPRTCICVNGPESTCPSCSKARPRLLPPSVIRSRSKAYREAAAQLERAMERPHASARLLEATVHEFIRTDIVAELRARADLLAGGERWRRRPTRWTQWRPV